VFIAALMVVLAVPIAALAQSTTTEPYSGGAVTETSLPPAINVAANGLSVNFTATGAGSDCTWQFGDDSTATGNPVTHIYAEEGDYAINATCGALVLARVVHFAADLNFTGMDVLPYLLAAFGLILIGGIVVRTNRRSKSTN